MSDALKLTGTYFYANGKRKNAIARVRLHKGNGRMIVNGKEFKDYFLTRERFDCVIAPLVLTKTEKQFDISAEVSGGGLNGQTEAMRHGISKALLEFNSELRADLKPEGYLTRDSRTKERKKFGLHRARRAPQFSKR